MSHWDDYLVLRVDEEGPYIRGYGWYQLMQMIDSHDYPGEFHTNWPTAEPENWPIGTWIIRAERAIPYQYSNGNWGLRYFRKDYRLTPPRKD